MKKTIICNIPMKEDVTNIAYKSDDRSLPTSEKPYRYPINSLLSQTVTQEDELKVVLLVKKDEEKFYEINAEYCRKEIEEVCKETGAKAEFVTIDTAFSQAKENHEELLGKIVDEIEVGAHVMADITYGPKDLPIVVFYALNFAENFLDCKIDNIVYSQATYKDNIVVSARICDMIPLYCLGSVTNIVNEKDPQKARQILKTLLSM